ncbi:MAG: polysaccharide deacetylase family protein [Clostridia bacterium]|nr:polysaccharide deacetylase family protein [Clostridia bacterium]
MIYMRFPGGKGKALTLSYDDGVGADLRLMKIMKKHGIKGTFNINSGLFAPEGTVFEDGKEQGRLTEELIRKNYDDPDFEVAVHGLYHIHLNHASSEEAITDIAEDRKNLEALFNRPVRGMAYAFGGYSEKVVSLLKSMGIAYSRTVVTTQRFDLPKEPLTLHPTCHHNNPRLAELCGNFLSGVPRYEAQMFYLWGHSYEFDDDNNWNVIEDFCEKMGGHDDIWYATNIEIIDYINAYKSLIRSFDGKIIQNPTATDIYITENRSGKNYVIKAGETIHLD